MDIHALGVTPAVVAHAVATALHASIRAVHQIMAVVDALTVQVPV